MVIKLLAFRPKAAAVCAKFDVHVALWVMLAIFAGQAVVMYMSWRRH
jgi:hypothetical protein